MSNAGVAAPPAGGLMLHVEGLGQIRGVELTVSQEEGEAALAQIEGTPADATHVELSAVRYNSALMELWALCNVAFLPELLLSPASPTEVHFPARYVNGQVVGSLAASSAGRPVVGWVVQPNTRAALDPSEGVNAWDTERRTWVLALWNAVQSTAARAEESAPGSTGEGRDASGWWVAGAVVGVGAIVYAVVYHLDSTVRVEHQAATDLRILTLAAQQYVDRLAEWRRTGTMPPIGEVERAAGAIVTREANAGYERMARSPAEVIAEAAKTGMNLVFYAGAAWLAYKVLSSDKG